MAAIDQATIQQFIDAGQNAPHTAGKGRAFEDLICYLFGLVPGVTITHRNETNQFHTEEIDVAIWNECDPQGLLNLPNLILIECKNWSKPVGSIEVNWFDSKLRNRGLDIGVLVAVNGITGDAEDLSAAHFTVASALKERRKLIVIRQDEIKAMADTSDLCTLIKRKICDLAVRGTLS